MQDSFYAAALDITECKHALQMSTTLRNIAECAHDCDSLSALYPQVHDIIYQIIPADRFYIALLDELTHDRST